MKLQPRFVSALALAALLLGDSKSVLAVDKGSAKYIGGTLVDMPEKAEGPIDLKGEKDLLFLPKKGPRLVIPWTDIVELEYGQKVARRWRSAILLSPWALLSKARKHFVTITFKDEKGAEQAAVLEFDKDDIRVVLVTLKARAVRDIVMQDEEAKKQMGSEKK
jgi:hypothetical protein